MFGLFVLIVFVLFITCLFIFILKNKKSIRGEEVNNQILSKKEEIFKLVSPTFMMEVLPVLRGLRESIKDIKPAEQEWLNTIKNVLHYNGLELFPKSSIKRMDTEAIFATIWVINKQGAHRNSWKLRRLKFRLQQEIFMRENEPDVKIQKKENVWEFRFGPWCSHCPIEIKNEEQARSYKKKY